MGFCILILYLLWTIVFDVVGLTLNGRDYIYKGIDWTTSNHCSLVSVLLCLFALLLYFANYFLVQRFTEQKVFSCSTRHIATSLKTLSSFFLTLSIQPPRFARHKEGPAPAARVRDGPDTHTGNAPLGGEARVYVKVGGVDGRGGRRPFRDLI